MSSSAQFPPTAGIILSIKASVHKRLRFLCLFSATTLFFLDSLKKKSQTKPEQQATLQTHFKTKRLKLEFLILFYCCFPLLPYYSCAQLDVMCYINLSHILYFTKFITHKFLIKWQGVFAQPLLSYLSDKPRRSKISRTLETHWGLVAHYQPDQGSASREVHITRFLKSRIQALG